MIFRHRTIAPQTAHVFTFLPDEASSDGAPQPPNLLAGRLEIADGVKWTLFDEQLDAGRKLLADVEAARPLLVVPIEAIPVRPVARSCGWALLAGGFATPHVLLAVDDPIRAPGPTTQIGAACLFQRHTKSLHKTLWSARNLLGGLRW
jgi:hypothetical protein